MGDLKGHAIPGSFFLFCGFWEAIGCLRRFLTSHRNGTRYVSTSTYTMGCFQGRVGRFPLESYFKIFLSVGGTIGELLAHLPVPPVRIGITGITVVQPISGVSLLRAYLLMLQGTWFWAVGIILYGHGVENTAWASLDGTPGIMLSTMYFSWHCAAHFIIIIALNVLLAGCSRKKPEQNCEIPAVVDNRTGRVISNKGEICGLLTDVNYEEA